MKINKTPVIMQVFSSGQRTRAQEPFELALQKARNHVVQLGRLVPTVLSGGTTSFVTAAQTASKMQASNMDVSQLQNSQMDANMQYLKLQMEVQAENRWFSTLSNVMKSRHDTARAAINNLRA